MTPDEFNQKRRELIAMRVKYKDQPEITTRANNLIGELDEWRDSVGMRRVQLQRMIIQNMRELSQLTAPQ